MSSLNLREYEKDEDMIWSRWSSWNSCSHVCGDGVRHRNRGCNSINGNIQCITRDSQTEPCFIKPCAEDSFDFWAEWSSCSISCGGEGKRSRTRFCATEDFRHNLQFSGLKFCADNPGTQWEPCFTPQCLNVLDSISHEPYRTRDPSRKIVHLTTSTSTTSTTTTTTTFTTTTRTTKAFLNNYESTLPPIEIGSSSLRIFILFFIVPLLLLLFIIGLLSAICGTNAQRMKWHKRKRDFCRIVTCKCCEHRPYLFSPSNSGSHPRIEEVFIFPDHVDKEQTSLLQKLNMKRPTMESLNLPKFPTTRGVRSASSRNSWDSSTAQCGTMTLDPDFDKPIEDQDLYQEPKSPLFHPLDDIQKVQAEINIIEKEDYDHASEYSYPEQNPFQESAIILTEEPDLTGHSWTPSVPEIAGNQTSTPPIVKKDDCNHEALVDSPTSSKSVQLERVNPHPENIEMKKESFEDIGAAEIIKDSLSFDDDDENSEIARIMNRPASNQMNADQRSSVATGLSSRRTSFLSKEIEALSNFSKLGVPMKLKNSFKKLGGLFRNKKKKEIVIDEGELIAAVEKHDASDVESGLAYQTPPEGVHPDEVLAPGVPDEFLDDFAVKHNIEGEEEDEEFQIPDERERVLDEILSKSHAASEASESQTTKKMNQ